MALEPLPLLLVLLSALMHAGWNVMAKRSHDGLIAMALIKLPNMLMAIVMLAVAGLPSMPSWPYLLGSALLNFLYFYALVNAYRLGDLSVAYPVARGTAPLMVLLISLAFVGEVPSAGAIAGVMVICLGILVIGKQKRATRQHYLAMLWAAGVGLCIAGYTVTDALGARLSGNPVGYVAVLMIVTGIAVGGAAALTRGPALLHALRTDWKNGVLGGVMMLGSYSLMVYALTLGPMAPLAALRESSVIFAAVLGAIVLREPFGAKRITAAAAVASGIAILVFLG
jgi:drug/metabolite transporter (DMT)-like permease